MLKNIFRKIIFIVKLYFQAKPNEYLNFGEFSQLKRLNTGDKKALKENYRELNHRYMADQSSLEEKRGSVRMRFRYNIYNFIQ